MKAHIWPNHDFLTRLSDVLILHCVTLGQTEVLRARLIKFKVTSLANNTDTGDFWQGLNAASVALQQAAQSETAVYQVFSEQLIKLGLHGSVNLLDETGERLCITSMVFSKRLMRVIKHAEKAIKINSEEFTYPAYASEADKLVLTEGDVVFLPDNSEKMKQIIPASFFQVASKLLKPFLKVPAVLAPIFAKTDVIGVLYVAGSHLQVEDVPAIAAFATHLSIALENARLFQAVQEAELKYRRLFESANDGIFLFDQESRQLVSANPKMLSLLGFEEEDVGTIRPSDWATPQIYQLYSKHLSVALQKGDHFFEIPFVNRHGQLSQWQISATIVELNNKPILHGLVRDITEAKHAEEALRQREEQFRVLAENVPGTIYLCKIEPSFQFLYVNDGIEALTGYPKEQFIRQNIVFSELIHPDDRADAGKLPVEAAPIKGQAFHYIYRIRHRSGEWRWAEDVGGGVFDESGNLLFLEGIISDITERIQADILQKTVYRIASMAHINISLNELYASIHESLAAMLNVQNFHIALYDEATGMINVPYFVDEYDAHLMSYKFGAGLTEFVLRTNESKLLTREEIEFYIKQGIIKLRRRMPQAWLGVPLQSQGRAIGALVVQSYDESSAYAAQDKQFLTFVSDQIATVVERKQAEERKQQLSAEVMQQARLLEAILTTTPDNFLVCDLDGRFLFISDLILDYLDIEADFALGKTWQEVGLPAEFGVIGDRDLVSVVQTGQPVTREIQYAFSNNVIEFEFITSPVIGVNGEVVSLVITARDVTERRQSMRAMHRTQKMESLGILAGGIAHDFNNLLVAMMGQASLAQVHLAHNHPAYNHVNKAVQAAEQAAGLTRQLLAYSGGGQFTIMPLNLNTLIKESIELLKVAMPKQIGLEMVLADALPLVEADTAQLQQVIMNLFINAAESIGERAGTIRVQTAVRPIDDQDQTFWQYTNLPLPFGNYVSLSVQDSGVGMKNETLAKIFDPFFTTKFTGRGLGLAAVLGIVRSHKGGLHVESKLGEGTIFELIFPVSEATRPFEHRPEAGGGMTAINSRVLVIDDEAPVREAITDILELEGIDVFTAANGDAGIALYKAQANEIDLVLLDLSMPGKSGRTTFEELEEYDANVRILLSSGYSEADATRGFNSPPLVGFLQKPYRLETFLRQLQKHLPSQED